MTGHKAKRYLKTLGWTQPAAAERMGVSFEHLNRVLNGHRESRRLLDAIAGLPIALAKKPTTEKGAK